MIDIVIKKDNIVPETNLFSSFKKVNIVPQLVNLYCTLEGMLKRDDIDVL